MYIHGNNRAKANKNLLYTAALNHFIYKHYRLITVFCDDDCCTPFVALFFPRCRGQSYASTRGLNISEAQQAV